MIYKLKEIFDSIPSFKGGITNKGQIAGSLDTVDDFNLAVAMLKKYLLERNNESIS